MELILKSKVEGLGDPGDIVKVKAGYARNFLIPKDLAVPATGRQKKILAEENRLRDVRDNKVKRTIQAMAEKMKDLSCTIVVQAGDEDKLYGSVTGHDIAEAIVKLGFDVDHKQVKLEDPIKILGVYTVSVQLHSEIEVPVKVWVVKE